MTPRPEVAPDPAWRESTLILVGHGSSRHPDSATPTLKLAETLAGRNLFKAVRCAFWRQRPSLQEVLAEEPAGTVHVVPNFAGVGVFTEKLIPQALGLEPGQAEGPRLGGRLCLSPPLGTHPLMPELIAEQVGDLIAGQGLDPATTGLLLIAHGSRRPGGSAQTPNALAEALRARDLVAEVRPAFLEQDPPATDWPSLIATPTVIVLPLLISRGYHGSGDMADLLDLDPRELSAATAPLGPLTRQGRRLWLIPTMTDEASAADLVLDLVKGRAVA